MLILLLPGQLLRWIWKVYLKRQEAMAALNSQILSLELIRFRLWLIIIRRQQNKWLCMPTNMPTATFNWVRVLSALILWPFLSVKRLAPCRLPSRTTLPISRVTKSQTFLLISHYLQKKDILPQKAMSLLLLMLTTDLLKTRTLR